jgi:hypothetical protein
MPVTDLYTMPGQVGLNLTKEKALLTAWVLLTSNCWWTHPSVRLILTDADLQKVTQDGIATSGTIFYIDLRVVQQALNPLTLDEVNTLFKMAQSDTDFSSLGAKYWQVGSLMNGFGNHYCVAMQEVLSLNQ